ncbi:MAG: acyltransferase family protein [Lachnospiraceae bacterium]|nr:acyltransferase family protein [Lachnospiraceae bacterium]
MHIAANSNYSVTGYIYTDIIPTLADFVFLFMVISAFSMCCGYYDKVLSGTLDITEFYKKRYLKVLPFFTCLVILDLIVAFSKASLYEAIADVSLTFGLFPNDIEVIGVGWFLGVIFAFYMLFPFYCVLIGTKVRAWIFFFISLIMNYICGVYFNTGGRNIVFLFCFFMAGGLIYLYREQIEEIQWFITLPILILSILCYYIFEPGVIIRIIVAALFVIFAIGNGGIVLINKVFRFISGISLEMYLSHMVIFRMLEKTGLNIRFGNGLGQYIITCVLVISIDIAFAFIAQKVINYCIKRI